MQLEKHLKMNTITTGLLHGTLDVERCSVEMDWQQNAIRLGNTAVH